MFRRLSTSQTVVRFQFEGVELEGVEGDSVAAALLANGYVAIGANPGSGERRGPYCLMGSCYECTVEIEQTAVQACQVSVTDGLVVRRCR